MIGLKKITLEAAKMLDRNDRNSSSRANQVRRRSARSGFWMRSVQFAGLHRILHRVSGLPEGVRAADLNRLIVEHRDYWTERGEPSKTTLYHCRNTLLNLGAFERIGLRLTVARWNVHVATLLDESPVKDDALSLTACEAFSALVLANHDCYDSFFRLFLPNRCGVSVSEFRQQAGSVVWRPLPESDGQHYELRSESSDERSWLTTPIQVKSILYGVRDWACKQLRLLDEFYDIGRGSVLFPLQHPGCDCAITAACEAILSARQDDSEWTTVSVRDLLRSFCERRGYSVHDLFDGITAFSRAYPGQVTLIATIPTFAAITATSRKRADFQLESAYRDSHGRLISHIRFHNSVREDKNG